MTTVISSQNKSTKAGAGGKKRAKNRKDAADNSLKPPTDEEIRIVAYSLFRKRQTDGLQGDALSDWVQAERLLAQNEES